jgi:hypothetical protein
LPYYLLRHYFFHHVRLSRRGPPPPHPSESSSSSGSHDRNSGGAGVSDGGAVGRGRCNGGGWVRGIVGECGIGGGAGEEGKFDDGAGERAGGGTFDLAGSVAAVSRDGVAVIARFSPGEDGIAAASTGAISAAEGIWLIGVTRTFITFLSGIDGLIAAELENKAAGGVAGEDGRERGFTLFPEETLNEGVSADASLEETIRSATILRRDVGIITFFLGFEEAIAAEVSGSRGNEGAIEGADAVDAGGSSTLSIGRAGGADAV